MKCHEVCGIRRSFSLCALIGRQFFISITLYSGRGPLIEFLLREQNSLNIMASWGIIY
jgi:hypothetical protein